LAAYVTVDAVRALTGTGEAERSVPGIVIAALVGVVLLGGIKSIASVTSRLVPAMAAIYVTACLVVILVNITAVPAAFGTIVDEAFNPQGVAGGILGALIVGGYYVAGVYAASYLQTEGGRSADFAFTSTCIAMIAAVISLPIAGYVGDRIGRRPVF
ncbi:hypothetical protein ADL27_30695, partial [Streptomyces sp. NRRL F-6602]